ncbi:hypothetical protein AAMO2058_000324500 [Amorphochlora amoebiformis]
MAAHTIDHLWAAAKMYARVCPEVSRLYIRQMKLKIKESRQVLHPSVQSQFCEECGTFFLPGENCSSRLQPLRRGHNTLKSTSNKSKKPHLMVTTCRVCKHRNHIKCASLGEHHRRLEGELHRQERKTQKDIAKRQKLQNRKSGRRSGQQTFNFRDFSGNESVPMGLVEAKNRLARKRKRKKPSLQDSVSSSLGGGKSKGSSGSKPNKSGDLYDLFNMFE